MHPGRLHRRQGLDGARQFPLEAPLKGHLLLELGHAQFGAVHQLETDRAALGQALSGEPEAQVVNLVGGHQDGAAGLLICCKAATTAPPSFSDRLENSTL